MPLYFLHFHKVQFLIFTLLDKIWSSYGQTWWAIVSNKEAFCSFVTENYPNPDFFIFHLYDKVWTSNGQTWSANDVLLLGIFTFCLSKLTWEEGRDWPSSNTVPNKRDLRPLFDCGTVEILGETIHFFPCYKTSKCLPLFCSHFHKIQLLVLHLSWQNLIQLWPDLMGNCKQ